MRTYSKPRLKRIKSTPRALAGFRGWVSFVQNNFNGDYAAARRFCGRRGVALYYVNTRYGHSQNVLAEYSEKFPVSSWLKSWTAF